MTVIKEFPHKGVRRYEAFLSEVRTIGKQRNFFNLHESVKIRHDIYECLRDVRMGVINQAQEHGDIETYEELFFLYVENLFSNMDIVLDMYTDLFKTFDEGKWEEPVLVEEDHVILLVLEILLGCMFTMTIQPPSKEYKHIVHNLKAIMDLNTTLLLFVKRKEEKYV